MAEVTHQLPPDGAGGIMPCCGRTPFEAPRTDRMTEDPTWVTCIGEVSRALVEKAAQAVYDVFLGINLRHPAYPQLVARAVLDAVLPDLRRQVAEEALRQAAEDVETARLDSMVPERVTQSEVADYLRKRAARIAREAGDRP